MLRTGVFMLFLIASAQALAIYKCETGGKVSYSDAPCPNGKTLPIASLPAADAHAARQRADREKTTIRRIESDRRKLEAREEKERQRIAHANAIRQKKCQTLANRKRWADEDAAAASGKAVDKARRKASRVAEQFDLECAKEGMSASR